MIDHYDTINLEGILLLVKDFYLPLLAVILATGWTFSKVTRILGLKSLNFLLWVRVNHCQFGDIGVLCATQNLGSLL